MSDIDEVASLLIEQSKRFLEKAREETDDGGKQAYRNAALLLGFCALEAHVNALAEELSIRPDLTVLDQSILLERDFRLEKGTFNLHKNLRMYRLEDRILYILKNHKRPRSQPDEGWLAPLKSGLDARNDLVHPKGAVAPTDASVARALAAILDCLDALYRAVHGKKHPARGRGLDSSLHF